MKNIFGCLVSLFTLTLSGSALADEPTPPQEPLPPAKIQVTSFQHVIPNQPLAELCGRIVGGSGETPAYIQAVVDATANPGVYHTVVGPTGRFCMTLVTYRGNARLSLWSPTGVGAPTPSSAPVSQLASIESTGQNRVAQ